MVGVRVGEEEMADGTQVYLRPVQLGQDTIPAACIHQQYFAAWVMQREAGVVTSCRQPIARPEHGYVK